MSKYARPRLTLVVDDDVAELVKQLAEKQSIPTATFAAAIFSKLVRDMAKAEGLPGEKTLMRSYKT